jgi:glycerophosphoryl diester phosphodiesterase
VVTGHKEGTVTITATAKDGSKKKDTYQVRVIGKITKDSTTKFIAHRGLSSEAPENTVKAFELAGQAGFWGAETDVRMTKDKKFVLMHDATLQRMCGVNKRVEDMTYEEIKSLTVTGGNNNSLYQNDSSATHVSSLEEYLEVCKHYQMVPVIEAKMEYSPSGDVSNSEMQEMVKADMQSLYDCVHEVMGDRQFIFIAFDLETIVQMRKVLQTDNLPNVSLQHLAQYPATQNANYYRNRNISISANYKHTTEAEIKTFHNAGIPVTLWTVDDQGAVWDYMKLGVEYITTNEKFW